MSARTDFPGVKQDGSDTDQQKANVINNTLLGKLNCTLSVTLRANQTTTTISDVRINTTSIFLFDARTANAKLAEYSMYVSSVSKGSATITHASTAASDKTFIVGIFA